MSQRPVSEFTRFQFDPSVQIAPVIYRHNGLDQPHRTTNIGLQISPEACRELRTFIQAHASLMKAKPPYFWRLDIYPHTDRLVVLEVNAHFVDGWGTALNLSRAAGIPVNGRAFGFPELFGCLDTEAEDCLPELIVLAKELAHQGQYYHRIVRPIYGRDQAVYVYGRPNLTPWPANIWPLDGAYRDHKDHLARLSRSWLGRSVTTPECYTVVDTMWDDVPSDVFLKFTRKDSDLLRRAGFSVKRGKPEGKAPAMRKWYNEGQLMAQDPVKPRVVDFAGLKQNAQLVVLTNGNVLTGYVQYSHRDIINDNSIHGPTHFLG